MRQVEHDTVIGELEKRGFDLEWVDDYDKEQVDGAGDYLADDVSTSSALDWFGIDL